MQLLSGSLNNDDSNSSENVAQKVNLGCSNFIAIIPTLLFCQNYIGDFFRSWFRKEWILVHKIVFLFSWPPQNMKLESFNTRVMQWLQRNVQKSVMHVQSCCFASLKREPIAFLLISLSLLSLLLKFPITSNLLLQTHIMKA